MIFNINASVEKIEDLVSIAGHLGKIVLVLRVLESFCPTRLLGHFISIT